MRRWFAKFRSGDFGFEDGEDRGRKPSIENDQLRTLVESNPQTSESLVKNSRYPF